jgi:hypothetical protein
VKNSDAINRIIEEVAVKHGISLGRDDPVLMVYTINRQLMESSAKIQQEALDKYLCSMEKSAGRIHNQAALSLDIRMREASTVMRQALLQEAERLFSQQRKDSQTINDRMMEGYFKWLRFAAFNAVSALTIMAAGIVLWFVVDS